LLNCFAQTKRDKQQWKRQFSLSPFEFGPVCVAKRGDYMENGKGWGLVNQ